MYTEEYCPYCEQEVLVPIDRQAPCPECGSVTNPCSVCARVVNNKPCDWKPETGCTPFPAGKTADPVLALRGKL